MLVNRIPLSFIFLLQKVSSKCHACFEKHSDFNVCVTATRLPVLWSGLDDVEWFALLKGSLSHTNFRKLCFEIFVDLGLRFFQHLLLMKDILLRANTLLGYSRNLGLAACPGRK